jgi:hypothetical protein
MQLISDQQLKANITSAPLTPRFSGLSVTHGGIPVEHIALQRLRLLPAAESVEQTAKLLRGRALVKIAHGGAWIDIPPRLSRAPVEPLVMICSVQLPRLLVVTSTSGTGVDITNCAVADGLYFVIAADR